MTQSRRQFIATCLAIVSAGGLTDADGSAEIGSVDLGLDSKVGGEVIRIEYVHALAVREAEFVWANIAYRVNGDFHAKHERFDNQSPQLEIELTETSTLIIPWKCRTETPNAVPIADCLS